MNLHAYRIIRVAVVAVLFVPFCANADAGATKKGSTSDILMAVMDNGRGEETMHQQVISSDQCDYMLEQLKINKKAGTEMQLTFTDPPYSGYVVELYCVKPDGSVKE